MINVFLYCVKEMIFSSSPKGTPTTGVVELWKKYVAMKTNGLRWHSFKKMNIFTGDLFSMYVVLQGIGSPSCIIIKYVIPFGEQQSWMSEVPKLERFNKKTGPPKWSISFHIVLKKWVFQAHRRVPPMTGVLDQGKKSILQWKPMDFGGIPSKIDEYFHWGPIFYVCSSARNRVPFMYDYYIRNSLWGAAILDIWSS